VSVSCVSMTIIPTNSIFSFPGSAWERHKRRAPRAGRVSPASCRCNNYGHWRNGAARGFTITEVLLTLGLLVIMSAMALPQLESAFKNQRLRTAADIVRTSWNKARIEAMNSGVIQVFRFEIEGNRFRLDPLATDAAAQAVAVESPLARSGAQIMIAEDAGSARKNLTGASADAYPVLPKDICFVSSQAAVDTRSMLAANSMATPGNALANDSLSAGDLFYTGGGWSEPIFFYPDGTTTSVQLWLRNGDGRMIQIALRGLTGTIKVGKVTTGAEQVSL
jgi:type II secretory pathway pseudopilin PulG